ncbi:MAG: sulfatase-like hydrolase/transferase, partial [Hyphomicrobiales bacterium]|nr:sulfatase-like hydrolase/transferase [Hyphomicrobiales bacterium]
MAPNILFIMCDQLRADCVEPEAADVKTPAIASLAREGLWSSNCFTNAPECIPARASLITGLYPHQSGITFNQPYTADVARPNWLQAIRAAGYHTSLFGKTHLHVTRGNMSDYQPWLAELGFDTANECGGPRELAIRDCELTRTWREAGLWDSYRADFKERFETVPHMVRPSPLGVDHYYDVFVAQRAKQFLETYESKQPFFCHVSFPGPHEPYDAPEPYASLYDPAKMKPAIRRPD